MQDEHADETAVEGKKKPGKYRPYKFYVVVNYGQYDPEAFPKLPKPPEVLEFESKGEMRAKLEASEYETAAVRVFRGYELNVKAKRNFSIS